MLCARGIIFVMSLGLNKYHKHSFILFNTLCVGRAKLSPACSSFLSVFWLRCFYFLFLSLYSARTESQMKQVSLGVCVCVCVGPVNECVCVCVSANLAKIH